MTPPFKSYPLSARLFLMMGLFLINYLIFFPAVALIFTVPFGGLEKITEAAAGNFPTQSHKYIFLFFQGVVSLGGFAFTAVLFSQLEGGEPGRHLRLNQKTSFRFIALAIAAVLVAQFFIEFLVTVNKNIPLPPALESLKESGKTVEKVTEALLAGTSVIQLLFNVIVIALVPAIAEEFFFRGLLLGDLLKEKMNPVFSILVSGFIFGIAHGHFSNVLAIWVLGSFLGYLYYVSGSLWLPIAAHFTNNFMAVLLKYLFNLGVISQDVANAETPLYATVISLVIFTGLLFLFNKWKKPVSFVEPEENIETPIEY